MYIPRYLKLKEVLPQETYGVFQNNQSKCWKLWDERILMAADILREKYGAVTCNNWHIGGSLQYRGYRPFDISVGAKLSAHKFFRALDLNFAFATPDEIRNDIKKGIVEIPVSRIEDDVTWLHIDTFNDSINGEIRFFKP